MSAMTHTDDLRKDRYLTGEEPMVGDLVAHEFNEWYSPSNQPSIVLCTHGAMGIDLQSGSRSQHVTRYATNTFRLISRCTSDCP